MILMLSVSLSTRCMVLVVVGLNEERFDEEKLKVEVERGGLGRASPCVTTGRILMKFNTWAWSSDCMTLRRVRLSLDWITITMIMI